MTLTRRNFIGGSVSMLAAFAFNSPASAAGRNDPVLLGGLRDHHGKLTTDEQFADKKLILYFGYPTCRHICPTAAMNIRQALEEAKRNDPRAAEIQPVFIVSKDKGMNPIETYTWQDAKEWMELPQVRGADMGALALASALDKGVENDPVLNRLYEQFRVSGAFNTHTPHAFLVDDGRIVGGFIKTQRGKEPIVDAIEKNFGYNVKPAAALAPGQ